MYTLAIEYPSSHNFYCPCCGSWRYTCYSRYYSAKLDGCLRCMNCDLWFALHAGIYWTEEITEIVAAPASCQRELSASEAQCYVQARGWENHKYWEGDNFFLPSTRYFLLALMEVQSNGIPQMIVSPNGMDLGLPAHFYSAGYYPPHQRHCTECQALQQLVME